MTVENRGGNELGKLIRTERIRNGFSQKALGDRCSVAQPTIGVWESGKNIPSVENLKNISLALRIPMQALCKLYPEPEQPSENALGKLIREERVRSALSQKSMAKLCSVSQATIGVWERGENTPSVENLKSVSQALKIPMEKLSKLFQEQYSGIFPNTDQNTSEKVEYPSQQIQNGSDRAQLLSMIHGRIDTLPTEKLRALCTILDIVD